MSTFLKYVENRISNEPNDKFLAYAGASFLKSCTNHGYDNLSVKALQSWGIDMLLDNLKRTTRKKYFSKIHTLYQEFRRGAEPITFDDAKEIIDYDSDATGNNARANLSLIKRLLKIDSIDSDYESISIFLYLLYNVEATLTDIISMKFDNTTTHISQLEDVIEAMRGTKRKRYVFGLGQGKKRETQIKRDMLHGMQSALTKYGFYFGETFSRESITAIWITVALNIGIKAGEICSIVRRFPDEYAYFKHIDVIQLTQHRKQGILQRVADQINDKSCKWFIMRMRAGKSPDDIKAAICSNFGTMLNDMAFYYPTRPVVRFDKHNRKVRHDEPYLPGILFFRMRCDKVATLFNGIGDMAWCYKTSAAHDSRYCTIPPREMRKFQMHIGKLTPDVRMELVTRDEPLATGMSVQINGGGRMEGHIGIIESVKNTDGTRTYTLVLSDYDIARWTVEDIEEVYVHPIQQH